MRRIITLPVIMMLLVACSSIDCPLNNTVYCIYSLRGDVETLTDTLTISTPRSLKEDTILINKQVNTKDLQIPMSYVQDADILYFTLTDTLSITRCDTVIITKTNEPHFESVDCSPSFFHTITDVRHTHNTIDSITISKSKVDYDTTVDNLFIYFKSDY